VCVYMYERESSREKRGEIEKKREMSRNVTES
jgi:hypothetical protein